MIRIFSLLAITLFLGLAIAASPSKKDSEILAYPEHLTGAFTSGFGEEACRSCHFDYDLNPAGGSLTVSGIDEPISAGERLEIQVTVERNELGRAGFQLSARYPNGSQAGQFNIKSNERLTFTETTPDSLQYVQHSAKGSEPTGSGISSWTIVWQAPESPQDTVIFNIAANAANGDQSEFGDFIYAKEIEVVM